MILRADFSQDKFKLMYFSIWKRIRDFALEYDIYLDRDVTLADSVANAFMCRLIQNDPKVVLLLELDPVIFKIDSHLLVTIEEDHKGLVLFIQQVLEDKTKSDFFAESLKYLESFKNLDQRFYKISGATKLTRAKAMERKYGFIVEKVMTSREIKLQNPIPEES